MFVFCLNQPLLGWFFETQKFRGPEKMLANVKWTPPQLKPWEQQKRHGYFLKVGDHPRWNKRIKLPTFCIRKIYIFMIMRQPYPPSNFSLDDEYVTVFNFTPGLTLTRFRYMDASSEVQAPSVVRSRQGGGTDVIWRIVFGDGKNTSWGPGLENLYEHLLGIWGNVTLFGMVSEFTWPEVTKNCWCPPMISDRKTTAWSTWGGCFLDKKTPINVLTVKVCTRKTSPTSDLFWVFVWTLHFCFFGYKVLRYISKLYPRGLQNTLEHVEVRKERSVKGLQNNKRKHAMGVGRTCALYLVFRHGQNIRKHTNVQWFSTWNKAKSHPQQLCFFPIFSSMKNVYLTTVAWKSLLLSWKKPIKTSVFFSSS